MEGMERMEKIKVGVSTCLLGESVRYDGGHKLDRFIRDVLGEYFDYYAVCPEQEAGLGTPREAMRLVGDEEDPKLLTNKTFQDKTGIMKDYIQRKLPILEKQELHGFIFKKGSPSSGLYRVKVYHENGNPIGKGSGLFAKAFTTAFPNLPVEEEGRLNDPHLRENFIVRVFAHHRWKEFLKKNPSVGDLVEYHTREKFLMMAHSVEHYKALGKVTAKGSTIPREELFGEYERIYLEGLESHATAKKNTNVLHHILGYFKEELSPWEKQEALDLIERYHDRQVPLVVPLTLLNHYIRKYEKDYLEKQRYLNPHPRELMLRNQY